jgi:hypothetical protein
MITIEKSSVADTRTCDYTKVTKMELYEASQQHIEDVHQALDFFAGKLMDAATNHDPDKITDIDGFHRDFVTGFKQTTWWDTHRKINRHHLTEADGVPPDVNLIDVLDYIADCVMAGMARSGSIRPIEIRPELLLVAFQNTVTLLHMQVKVRD